MNQNWRYRFTVFTPTYNRAHTLPRVYESLKNQTFRDFEWLIVDDGSTDNTGTLIEAWQKEKLFPIRYFWQKNAHKKTAFNRGVQEAHGELFLSLDSDDEILPQAMVILDTHWRGIPESEQERFAEVEGLCVDEKGVIVGSKFPQDVIDSDYLAMHYRYKVVEERWGCHRTDVLRKFPFPEDVKGHVPESVVWAAIAVHYKTRFINEVLRVYHPEADSLMHNLSGGAQKYSDGHALWAREVLCNEWRWFFYDPKWFLKMAANYTRFHKHLKKSQPGKHWPLHGFVPYLLMILMWPVGLLRYALDKTK